MTPAAKPTTGYEGCGICIFAYVARHVGLAHPTESGYISTGASGDNRAKTLRQGKNLATGGKQNGA